MTEWIDLAGYEAAMVQCCGAPLEVKVATWVDATRCPVCDRRWCLSADPDGGQTLIQELRPGEPAISVLLPRGR